MQSNQNDTNDTNEHAPITEAELVELEHGIARAGSSQLGDYFTRLPDNDTLIPRLLAEARRHKEYEWKGRRTR